MMEERIVLDTNCLVMAISARNRYHQIWQSFLEGRYILCFSTEMLEEYEEVLARNINSRIAQYVLSALLNRRNVCLINVYFKFGLIAADPDDNKFVDCAIAANARFIVTEDKYFEALKEVDFPRVDIIGIDAFIRQLDEGS